MTTELQEAPKVGVSEHVDEIEKIPEMVAHLYHGPGMSFCGLRAENDPHSKMHLANGWNFSLAPPGTQACVKCGAPVCEACFAKNV